MIRLLVQKVKVISFSKKLFNFVTVVVVVVVVVYFKMALFTSVFVVLFS